MDRFIRIGSSSSKKSGQGKGKGKATTVNVDDVPHHEAQDQPPFNDWTLDPEEFDDVDVPHSGFQRRRHSVHIPVHEEDIPNIVAGSPIEPNPPSSGKPPVPATSRSPIFAVHFSKVVDPDGKTRAVCNYCGKSYAFKSGVGYGSYTRHIEKHHPTEKPLEKGQTQIRIQPTTSQRKLFKYDEEKQKEGLCKMISGMRLSFESANNPFFIEYQQQCLNPNARSFSSRTMRRELQKAYHKGKRELLCKFSSLDTLVSICADVWTDRWQRNSYMGITCHWIDGEWMLNKRLLALRKFNERHTAHNIHNTILTILNEYGIRNKIMSIGLDNASANNVAVSELEESCCPIFGSSFFHIRCVCHILNLCVKDGLAAIDFEMSPVRQVVEYIIDHRKTLQLWLSFCKSNGVPQIIFKRDVKHRWNSTYELLQSTIPYINTLCSFAVLYIPHIRLSERDWEACSALLNLLKVFYTATNTFSQVYRPSIHLFLLEASEILTCMRECRYDPKLDAPISDMLTKWMRYYADIPNIYLVACVLDPRCKLSMLQNILEGYITLIDQLQNSDSDSETQSPNHPSRSAAELTQKLGEFMETLYNHLSTQFGGQVHRSSAGTPPIPSGSRGRSEAHRYYTQQMKRPRGDYGSEGLSELEAYYMTTFEFPAMDDVREFDILGWWKLHTKDFPILSRLARLVLAAPASTVSVEQVFSTAGLILTDHRASLSPVNVEASACLEDWERAEKREQEPCGTSSGSDDYLSDFNSSGGSSPNMNPSPPNESGSEDE